MKKKLISKCKKNLTNWSYIQFNEKLISNLILNWFLKNIIYCEIDR